MIKDPAAVLPLDPVTRLTGSGTSSLRLLLVRIAMADINTAYERMLRGDVKYRFVIDLATL